MKISYVALGLSVLSFSSSILAQTDNLTSRLSTLSATSPKFADDAKDLSELSKKRRQSRYDNCLNGKTMSTFQESIEAAVVASMRSLPVPSNAAIDKGYGLNSRTNIPVSLISHPLCEQNSNQISHILGSDRVPDTETIERLKTFVNSSNKDRSAALRGDDAALQRFVSRWTAFMGCLAYSESLQTADAENAEKAFKELMSGSRELRAFYGATSNKAATKPSGVHFGRDRVGPYFKELRKARAQNRANAAFMSALDKKYPAWAVTGLYQFDPTRAGGNISPCIDQWNNVVAKTECKINRTKPNDVFVAFASYGQTMNAYCGVQKIVQAFNSQANTSNATGTDLNNRVGGKLKAAKDRCVGMVSRGGAGKIYSHFGPLANSVGDNLKSLMGCVHEATKSFR